MEKPAEGTQTETTKPADAAPAAPAADAPASTAAPQGDGAKPAGDTEPKGDAEPPKTALEAAQRVMAKEGSQPSDAKPQQSGDAQKPTPAEAAKSPEDKGAAAEDDDSKLPFKDHPRWKKMSSEHRMLKVAKEKNEEAIKSLEPKAKAVDDLTGYLRDNNLEREDFQNGLTIMAAIKSDPAKAYGLLRPIMDRLELATGARLPDDLKAKVEAGTVDAETAAELARTRAAEARARTQAESIQQRTTHDTQERERQELEGQIKVVTDTMNAWDAEWMKRDPDAAKLRPFVEDLLMLEGSAKPPRNAEEARALCERAVTKARERLGAFVPAPKPKEGRLPDGGLPVETAVVPKSSLEAAQAALASLR
jgi:hypothetical protein